MSRIKTLTKSEKYDAVNLVKEVFFSSGNLGLSRTAAKSFLEFLSAHGQELTWLGYYEQDLQGVLAFKEAHISLLFVREEARNRGIASELLKEYLQLAEKQGIQRITLNAIGSAVEFYKQRGFEKAGEPSKAADMSYQLMEYLLGKQYLGKVVHVTVDQPYGSLHAHIPDLCLPCNVGYVDECIGDGDFQDAYVYGIQEPIEKMKGIVIGIIYHRDESATRWIVAEGNQYDKQDVFQTIAPLETDYDIRIEWL